MKVAVFPRQSNSWALSVDSCLYSVSLVPNVKQQVVQRDALVSGYLWAVSKFQIVNVILSDGPMLMSSLLIHGYSSEEASIMAAKISDMAFSYINGVSEVSMLTKASMLVDNPAFKTKLSEVKLAFIKNAKLNQAVQSDAAKYISRIQKHKQLQLSFAEALVLAKDYILFELAVYAFLAELGYFVDVYVGDELPTLKMFMRGKFEEFPELRARACISLKPGE